MSLTMPEPDQAVLARRAEIVRDALEPSCRARA